MLRREVLVSAREVIAIKLLGTTLLLRLTGFTVLNLCVLLLGCLAKNLGVQRVETKKKSASLLNLNLF